MSQTQLKQQADDAADLNEVSLERKAALLSGQSQWQTRGDEQLGIPPMHMSDGPSGLRKQSDSGDNLGIGDSQPSTCFPAAVTMGMSWDPSLAEQMGRALGAEARALNVNVLLGPGLCMKRNPLCGRNFEYISEDPIHTGRMGAAIVRGIQANRIAACPKHFAANNQELRRMASNSVVDERTLRELYLTAFEIVIREAHPRALMTSYNRINGTYTNENMHLVHDILRGEWGFDGLVVSDWGGSRNIADGVRAGSTLEMPGAGMVPVRELVDAVEHGDLDEQFVNDRVAELARVARETQIEELAHDALPELPQAMIDEHNELAADLAAQCITLLRNDNKVLPLAAGSHIAVVGDLAGTPRFQGAGSSQVNATSSESLLHALTRTEGLTVMGYAQGYERDGKSHVRLIRQAAELCRNGYVDAIVVAVGLPESYESEGIDRQNMQIPRVQHELIDALARTGKPVIAVVYGGSAMKLPWVHKVQSILYAGLPGQGGSRAIASVIMGQTNPSGHLTETWPLKLVDVPNANIYPAKDVNAIYAEGPLVGYRYYETARQPVRYPFGFGLSYSTFEYSNLQVTEQGVTVTVSNVDGPDGATVVQLYVTAAPSGGIRIARELKGFAKVQVPAGESVEVSIPFDEYTFRHFDTTLGRWTVTRGQYSIAVGANAHDLPLQKVIFVSGDVAPEPYDARLGAYLEGAPQRANEQELEVLFGGREALRARLITDGITATDVSQSKSARARTTHYFTSDDPISDWRKSSNWIARSIAKRLHRKAYASLNTSGTPDLGACFVLYMTPHSLKKLTGGRLDEPMVDAIVDFANGRSWHGLCRFVRAAAANKRANKAMQRRLEK
ncbi:glycosyl hydrolase [Bifidobacterium dolichotidis]|uniref:Glycosyl hydrolase n=1 Tax=Bifidobacterium dolichotidis TaxID=2306976 RepID=A0A430FNW1_9BIFI|nr:glycoside hydrolase family 3 C-terminal domain-containing protein [Bifidobacterium dolichotidis]RSX54515.1 glycosyl hydrolase [Bifidobacterium dolichotidis]